ncbi:hypothetical protein K8I61_13090 [bacterium]|nr:hypothetical protein [bacterium]
MQDKATLKKVTVKTPIMDLEWEAGGKGHCFATRLINGIRRRCYNKWKNRVNPLRIVNFSYLSYDLDKLSDQTEAILSLLKKYGWSGFNIDNCKLSKANVYNVDNNIFALAYDLEPGCLDFSFNRSKNNGELVEFIVDDQLIIGGLYIMVSVRDKSGVLCNKCINITTVKSDQDIGPHGDGSYEWKAYAPTLNIKKGWQSIRVNVPLVLKKQAFNGIYTLDTIIGIRLRGKCKIVGINSYNITTPSKIEPSDAMDADTSEPSIEPDKLWYSVKGTWAQSGDVLELNAPDIGPDAYYVWNSRVARQQEAVFNFNFSFLSLQKTDIRLVVFAKSPTENYQSSDHLVIYCPWESGGFRVDILKNDKIEHIHREDKNKPSFKISQNHKVKVKIKGKTVRIFYDGSPVLIASDERLLAYTTRGQWYWGFSTVCGNVRVSNIYLEPLENDSMKRGALTDSKKDGDGDFVSHPKKISQKDRLVKSTTIRTAMSGIVFLLLEFAVGRYVNQYGEGSNFLQKSVNSWVLYACGFGAVAFIFPFYLGKERLKILKLWKGDSD